MTLPSKPALSWQAKTAFACAGLFSLTSISTNAIYGWSKGDTLPSQIIWAALAIATGTTMLLATAGLFKALAARRWGHALFVAPGLTLCATYSIVAAVGSTTGQRMSAALSENNATSRRTDSQKAIAEASGLLAQLPQNRPSAAISAEIDGVLIDPKLDGCKENRVRGRSAHTSRISERNWQRPKPRRQTGQIGKGNSIRPATN